MGKNAQGSMGLRQLLPTLSAVSYGSNRGGSAGRTGPDRPSLESLMRQQLLPTLTARDWRSGAASEATHARPTARPLNETLNRGQDPAYLNPRWCEIFMGFPVGWTDPPEGFVAPVSTRSGTRLSRNVPK